VGAGSQGLSAVGAGDLDGDGDLDLVAGSEADSRVVWYEQRRVHRSPSFGEASLLPAQASATRDVGVADVDGDGDLDVLLTQCPGKPKLLRNDQALGHHWLRLELVGRGGNRDALGARVEVEVAGIEGKLCQEVVPFRSYLSQNELPLTFGLGAATQADKVVVHWPDGAQQELVALAADRLHRIEQAQ
jgi:hypothetical protein